MNDSNQPDSKQKRAFLRAEWKNLLMANYVIDPGLLKPHLPCHTELDDFEGNHYVSLVGFLFAGTRVKGIAFPFHTTFEEVNLRFYVRYKDEGHWKRGVVFMKEIVPRRMITIIANSLYGENYRTYPMRHNWKTNEKTIEISYQWKVGGNWNYIKATAERGATAAEESSVESFITEHYWGYTRISEECTGVYEVRHPRWRLHKVLNFEKYCDTKRLYGREFTDTLNAAPQSVFLADGSPVEVLGGSKLYLPL